MSFAIITQVSVLFILLSVGFICRKINLITDDLIKGLSNIIINVCLPALIITSLNYKFDKGLFKNTLILLIVSLFIYIALFIVGYIFTKVLSIKNSEKGVYIFLLVFSNVGFMGFPVINIVYGNIGIFYSSFILLWFNLLLWTVGIILVNPKDKFKLKSVINPGIISLCIGLAIFIFSLKIPKPIYLSLKSLANTTTPLAMMVVGALLGSVKLKSLFKDFKLLTFVLLKLLLIPLVLLIVLKFFIIPDIIIGILVIIFSMPSAVNASIFSRRYDSDYILASKGVFLTTFFSIVTIPLIIYTLI
ncbi:MAG: AEC family transporter [Firmicutes bacterium]|nr:AEC family transporter [Bacillota bacterium]